MSTIYSWAEIRERAAAELGGYPDAALEQEILEVFRERPAFVVGVVADVTRGYQRGAIHSPWLLIRKQAKASPVEELVTDASERTGAVKRAELWLRRAGLHIDRESELLDELFGERGPLRAWADDEALRAKLVGLWRELRPLGEPGILEGAEAQTDDADDWAA
jgi:hypothetical protein